jgi:hypothetical protein
MNEVKKRLRSLFDVLSNFAASTMVRLKLYNKEINLVKNFVSKEYF